MKLIKFPVAPMLKCITMEPTSKPIRNVNTRRGKKRDRAKLNGLLQRLQAWVPGDPKRHEAPIEIGAISPDAIMDRILQAEDLIVMMFMECCTHLLVGPDFHHTLCTCPMMQFNMSVRIASNTPLFREPRYEVFGFIVVVVPWMSGFLPITDPSKWPRPA